MLHYMLRTYQYFWASAGSLQFSFIIKIHIWNSEATCPIVCHDSRENRFGGLKKIFTIVFLLNLVGYDFLQVQRRYLPITISTNKRFVTLTTVPIFSAWNTFFYIELFERKKDEAASVPARRQFVNFRTLYLAESMKSLLILRNNCLQSIKG